MCGSRAALRDADDRLRRHRVVRAVMFALLLTVFLAGPGAISGETSAVAREVQPGDARATLSFAPRDPVVLPTADRIEITVSVTNPFEDPLPPSSLRLELGMDPITSAHDLAVHSPAPPTEPAQPLTRTVPVTELRLPTTPPGTTRTQHVTIDRAALPLRDDQAGHIFVLHGTVEPDTGERNSDAGERNPDAPMFTPIRSETPLFWGQPTPTTDATAEPLAVSVIAPMVLPPEVWSLPTREQLSELFTPEAPLPSLLDEAERSRATLALDPRIPVAIRAFGDEAPADARAFLDRLERTSLPTFLLQYGDADLAAQAALGLGSPIEPSGVSYYLDRHFPDASPEDADAPTSDRQPSGTGEEPAVGLESATQGEAPRSGSHRSRPGNGSDADETVSRTPVPTFAQLSAWSPALPGVAWPAFGRVNETTLEFVDRNGFQQVFIADLQLATTGGPRATLPRTDLEAVVIHTALTREFAAIATDASEGEQRLAQARVFALLHLISQESPTPPGIVIALDRATVANNTRAAELLAQVRGQEWVTTVPLHDQPLGSAELIADAQDTMRDGADAERLTLLAATLDRETAVRRAGDALIHPEFLAEYQRLRVLSLFATRWVEDSTAFADAVDDFQNRDAELIRGVHPVDNGGTQVFGREGRIPVQLTNGLPFDVEVTGSVQAANGALSITEPSWDVLTLAGNETQTVLVPVNARVTSGQSGFIVELTTVDGETSLATQSFAVSISSRVETVAVAVIGVLAAAFVGIGLWRSVQRRRHDAASPPHPAESGTE